jgi:hypothetical protein
MYNVQTTVQIKSLKIRIKKLGVRKFQDFTIYCRTDLKAK